MAINRNKVPRKYDDSIQHRKIAQSITTIGKEITMKEREIVYCEIFISLNFNP